MHAGSEISRSAAATRIARKPKAARPERKEVIFISRDSIAETVVSAKCFSGGRSFWLPVTRRLEDQITHYRVRSHRVITNSAVCHLCSHRTHGGFVSLDRAAKPFGDPVISHIQPSFCLAARSSRDTHGRYRSQAPAVIHGHIENHSPGRCLAFDGLSGRLQVGRLPLARWIWPQRSLGHFPRLQR